MTPYFSKALSWSICLSLLFFQYSLLAQKTDVTNGYYISSKGDSLNGQIHYGDLRHNVLKFRASNQDSWTTLSPQLVKVISGDKEFYALPKEIRTSEGRLEYIFVQRILGGGYSLYKGYTATSSALFFVQLPGDKNLVKINSLGYGPQLKSLLNTCGQQAATGNLRYNAASLIRFFTQVNQCAFPDQKISILKNKIKPRLGIGLSAMYYVINPKVGELTRFSANYQKVGRFNGALSARLQITPALSLHAGINYVDKRIKSDSVLLEIGYNSDIPGQPSSWATDFYRFAPDLNFTYWEIPIGLTHNFLNNGSLSPSYSLGFVVQIPKIQRIEFDWGYPVCPDNHSQPCFLPPGESGYLSPKSAKSNKYAWVNFFAGLGLRKTMKSKNEWEVRVDYFNQYEKAKVDVNKVGIIDLFMKTSRFQANVNYYFYFKKGAK